MKFNAFHHTKQPVKAVVQYEQRLRDRGLAIEYAPLRLREQLEGWTLWSIVENVCKYARVRMGRIDHRTGGGNSEEHRKNGLRWGDVLGGVSEGEAHWGAVLGGGTPEGLFGRQDVAADLTTYHGHIPTYRRARAVPGGPAMNEVLTGALKAARMAAR
jgi:hypothetical protein